LINQGYGLATFEKSPQALASMQRRGMRVYSELADLPAAAFDVITAWHVVEHLEEPAAVLSRLVESLKPGGSMLIAVPNAEGLFARLSFDHWVWTMPWHLHYFTHRSLEQMLTRCGLQPREITSDSGDIAALELFVGGLLLRAPSRLTRQSGKLTDGEAHAGGTLRTLGAPVLRPISRLLQGTAKRFGMGEELVVHAVKP
jgi:SAM-dependent methyltransferase